MKSKDNSPKSSPELSYEKEFRIAEYQALRAEILELKKRVMHIKIVGITSIPIIVATVDKYDMKFVLIVSPIIVIAFVLLIMSEQWSIMRVGRYIRTHIEKEKKLDGWECWLETRPPENRIPEIVFVWAVLIVFCIYYIGSCYLAWKTLLESYSSEVATVSIGLYSSAFIIILFITAIHFPIRGNMPSNKEGKE